MDLELWHENSFDIDCVKYPRIRVFCDYHFATSGQIYDSLLTREYTGQRNPVFWHTLRSVYLYFCSVIVRIPPSIWGGVNPPFLRGKEWISITWLGGSKKIKKGLKVCCFGRSSQKGGWNFFHLMFSRFIIFTLRNYFTLWKTALYIWGKISLFTAVIL